MLGRHRFRHLGGRELCRHVGDNALVDQMEICALKFGPGINEMEEAGRGVVPGEMVLSTRIGAALKYRREGMYTV